MLVLEQFGHKPAKTERSGRQRGIVRIACRRNLRPAAQREASEPAREFDSRNNGGCTPRAGYNRDVRCVAREHNRPFGLLGRRSKHLSSHGQAIQS